MSWLDRMRTTELYRYDFDPAPFNTRSKASGQWTSYRAVEPLAVVAIGNLIDLHAEAQIELRLVPNLWPLVELVNDDRWAFSIVRIGNATAASDVAYKVAVE